MLNEEYKYFEENKKKFLEKYKDKFLVIKNQQVLGVYDTEEEAYEKTIKENELGTFLIQQCVVDEDKLTQTFHSRVIF